MNLRRLAQGKPCYLRLEGCTHDASQTVLAHVRRGGVAGVGQKPPDVCGVWACSACHDAMDRRSHRLPIGELDAYTLEALCRQLAWYDKHEILVAVL